MRITKLSTVEHRALSGFDLGPQTAAGGARVLAPGACSCTSCCSCSAAKSVE